MTPIIDFLTDHGGILLAGSSVLLGIGTIATAVFGRPVQRQRLGELALAATMAWLLLACVPLPRWDIGAGELLASAKLDTQPIAVSRVASEEYLDEPLSNVAADAPVDDLAVGGGFAGQIDVAQGGMDIQPPASRELLGATVAPTVGSSPVTMGPRVGWRRTLAVSYSVGVVGCLMWLLAGHVLLARTERIATVPDAWLDDLCDSATGGRGLKRARLLVSKECRRPAVYGFWRPVIILPTELCRPENSERLRHVLRHESAHVWRGDARGNLIVNAAFPFLFFHPLFWWIRHRVQFSRELIADDWAAGLSSKESYADELVQLVSQGRGARLGAVGILGVFRFNTPFYRRMKMLIDRRQPLATTLPLTWRFFGILVGVMLVAAMASVAGVPQATAEGDEGEPPAVETAESEIVDEPFSGGGMADSSPVEEHPRQPLDEAIRAALENIPGVTVQSEFDAKTGRMSVAVGVPAEHFDRVWQRKQVQTGRTSGRKAMAMGGGRSGGGGIDEGGGFGRGSANRGSMPSGGGFGGGGGGGMSLGGGRRSSAGGFGGGGGVRIPEDQMNRVQIQETANIRDTVTALLQETAPDSDSSASVDLSVVREIRLKPCIVTLIDDVKIPAQTEGRIVELAVREGDQVERGQVLAQIDDRRARLKLDEVKGLLEDAKGNNVDVKYAEVALQVASADYENAIEVNRNAPGTVPKTETRRLMLQVEQFKLQVEQAQRAKAGTRAQKAQLALAESELADYDALAPLDGIVVEVFPQVGEWVKAGDPICRIVRMDRLRVESWLDVSRYSPDDVHGSDVIIEFPSRHGKVQRMPGKVTFVSPMRMDERGNVVIAEVPIRAPDERYLLAPRSGMEVTMVVKLVSRPGQPVADE